MANKFAEDIRRIAKGTRFKGPLGVYSPRDPIGPHQVSLITDPMALGGGYGDGGLNNETPTSEAPNSDTQQTVTEGGQTSAQDPNNPNTFYKGGAGDAADSAAGEGSFDVEDVIDGTDGPQTSIDGTSGGINEFTGMIDCETETPFNFHPDGFFPAPEGWDDSETPPINPEYVDGEYWRTNSNGTSCSGSYSLVRAPIRSTVEAAAEAMIDEELACLQALPSGAYQKRISETENSTSYIIDELISGNQAAEVSVIKSQCVSPSDDGTSYCPLTPPLAECWPEDGTFDLANIDGKIVTSEFDCDAPSEYSSSAKDFCFGDGRTGKMLVTADGGTMMYETSNGAPTGTARVYKPDGTMRAAGDATETFTSQYLPK